MNEPDHNTSTYVLMASAFVLAALVIIQTSRVATINEAHAADMTVTKDFVTMLSTQATTDSDIVYLLDSRNERLAAYQVDPNNRIIRAVTAFDIGRYIQGGGRR